MAQRLIREEELFARLQSGDEQAFDQLFRKFYPGLCFFARRFTPFQGTAEEIVQDTLFKVWQRRENFDNYSSLKAFLYISTKNACRDSADKEQRKLNREHNWFLENDQVEPDAEENIIYTEVLIEISQALDKLPEQCRKVMKMSYEQGMNGKEIAEVLQLSVSTVNNQKARGVSLLRKLLTTNTFTILMVLLAHQHRP
jgi:RNA polymerase sigma-70 factor (family 1)